jgi:hypothetical protein
VRRWFAALAVTGSLFSGCGQPGDGTQVIEERVSPESFIASAEFAGVGTVTRIEAGRSFGGERGATPVETQVVTLRVSEQWAGEPADELRLFAADPPHERATSYERGRSYLLLLGTSPERDMFGVVGPDVRLEVRDGIVRSLTKPVYYEQLEGLTVAEAAAVVRRLRGD